MTSVQQQIYKFEEFQLDESLLELRRNGRVVEIQPKPFFLILYLLIDRTDFGLALQATSEDRDAAMLVGIRPQRMYAVAWGLGTALVAIAGVILANFFSVYPQAGLSFTVLAYAIVALGGFGSILGTLMAALLVGVVQSVTAAYLPPAFKDAFVFASYILIGLFRPQGLFGRF